MIQQIQYQICLNALTEAVSDSVTAIQVACSPKAKTADSSPSLIDTIRENYATRLKRLFDGKKADSVLEHELGLIYGALTTRLLAVHASWSQYKAATNPHIDLDAEYFNHLAEAVRAGEKCMKDAADSVCRLMRADALISGKAELFIKMVGQHVKDHDVVYRRDPNSTFFSYSPLGVHLGQLGRKEVHLEFSYWDGADAMGGPLSLLFPDEAGRALLERLASIAFGGPVPFSNNHSTITFEGPTFERIVQEA